MKTKIIVKLSLCALPVAVAQHVYASSQQDLSTNEFNSNATQFQFNNNAQASSQQNLFNINKINSNATQFQFNNNAQESSQQNFNINEINSNDPRLSNTFTNTMSVEDFKKNVTLQYIQEKIQLALKGERDKYDNKKNVHWISKPEYSDSIYKLIANEMAKCYMQIDEYSEEDATLIEFKNPRILNSEVITPDKYKFNQPQWNVLILKNLLYHLIWKKLDSVRYDAPINSAIMSIKDQIEHQYQQYDGVIKQYDQNWRQTLFYSAAIVRHYVERLQLQKFIDNNNYAQLRNGLNFSEGDDLLAKGDITYDKDKSPYRIEFSYSPNSHIINTTRILETNMCDVGIEYDPNMNMSGKRIGEYHLARNKVWSSNLQFQDKSLDINVKRMINMVNTCLGFLYISPSCRTLIDDIYEAIQDNKSNSFELNFVKGMRILYKEYDLFKTNTNTVMHGYIKGLADALTRNGIITKEDFSASTIGEDLYPKWDKVLQKIVNILDSARKQVSLPNTTFTMVDDMPYVYSENGAANSMLKSVYLNNNSNKKMGKVVFLTRTEKKATPLIRRDAYQGEELPLYLTIPSVTGNQQQAGPKYTLIGYLYADKINEVKDFMYAPLYMITPEDEMKKNYPNEDAVLKSAVLAIYELDSDNEG